MTTNAKTDEVGEPLSLCALLKNSVIEVDEKPSGRLEDLVVKLHQNDFAPVTGILVQLGKSAVFVPAADILEIRADRISLKSEKWDLRPFAPRDGEVLLKRDILGRRVIDIPRSALVKAFDVRLARGAAGWAAVALDVHRTRWFHFGSHETHAARDWRTFLPIPADKSLPTPHSSPNWIGRLKPAQIADLIEAATRQEQDALLAQVHSDPELEADVFEELEDGSQAQLLKSRSDADVADLLSRMRADDVADAVMDLPQERRRPVLDLVPESQRIKIMMLLGYNEATAGGLMGTEFLALDEERTIADALQLIREATTQQPEALVTIHSLGPDGKLAGTLGLVRALQLAPETLLRDAADRETVVASPEDDIVSVTTRMADFNLLSLPVVDDEGQLLGVVTVDDALEAAIPRNWARR